MLVVPADAHIDPERDGIYRDVLADGRGRTSRPAPSTSRTRWSRSGSRSTHPATEYGYLIPRARPRRDDRAACAPIRSRRFEEKPKPARAEELVRQEGVAWNAGIFLWRRRAIRAALERYTGLVQLLGPTIGAPAAARSTPTSSSSRSRSTTP